MLKDTEAYLYSKKSDFSELRSMESTTKRKETAMGAADGERHESDAFDICLAGAKLEPNMQDNAEEFRNTWMLFKNTVTAVPPR